MLSLFLLLVSTIPSASAVVFSLPLCASNIFRFECSCESAAEERKNSEISLVNQAVEGHITLEELVGAASDLPDIPPQRMQPASSSTTHTAGAQYESYTTATGVEFRSPADIQNWYRDFSLTPYRGTPEVSLDFETVRNFAVYLWMETMQAGNREGSTWVERFVPAWATVESEQARTELRGQAESRLKAYIDSRADPTGEWARMGFTVSDPIGSGESAWVVEPRLLGTMVV